MSARNTIGVIVAFFFFIALLLLFGGGAMTGSTMSGGMMGNGVMVGIGWMWIPVLLVLGVGGALAWAVFGHKK